MNKTTALAVRAEPYIINFNCPIISDDSFLLVYPSLGGPASGGARVLHDGSATEDSVILERYFNDVYKLFLRQVTRLDEKASLTEREKNHLQSLFAELIKVKVLLSEGEEQDEGDEEEEEESADSE